MKKSLLTSAITAAATFAMIGVASAACSPGYKPVKIQGNWVCKLDASASNSFQAKSKPRPQSRSDIGQKLQFQLQEKNNVYNRAN